MSNSVIPTQLGYCGPYSKTGSRVILGRDYSASFEAIGLGEGRRPDALKEFTINISELNTVSNDTTSIISGAKQASFRFNVDDITQIKRNNNMQGIFDFKIREVSVCEVNDSTGETEERKMLVLASQTYASGQASL